MNTILIEILIALLITLVGFCIHFVRIGTTPFFITYFREITTPKPLSNTVKEVPPLSETSPNLSSKVKITTRRTSCGCPEIPCLLPGQKGIKQRPRESEITPLPKSISQGYPPSLRESTASKPKTTYIIAEGSEPSEIPGERELLDTKYSEAKPPTVDFNASEEAKAPTADSITSEVKPPTVDFIASEPPKTEETECACSDTGCQTSDGNTETSCACTETYDLEFPSSASKIGDVKTETISAEKPEEVETSETDDAAESEVCPDPNCQVCLEEEVSKAKSPVFASETGDVTSGISSCPCSDTSCQVVCQTSDSKTEASCPCTDDLESPTTPLTIGDVKTKASSEEKPDISSECDPCPDSSCSEHPIPPETVEIKQETISDTCVCLDIPCPKEEKKAVCPLVTPPNLPDPSCICCPLHGFKPPLEPNLLEPATSTCICSSIPCPKLETRKSHDEVLPDQSVPADEKLPEPASTDETSTTDSVPRDKPTDETNTTDSVPREKPTDETSTKDSVPREKPTDETSTTDSVPRDTPTDETNTTDSVPRDTPTDETNTTDSVPRDKPADETSTTDSVPRDKPTDETNTTDSFPP